MLFGRSAAPERTEGPLTRCSTRLYREPTTFKVRVCVVLGGLTCVNVIGHPLVCRPRLRPRGLSRPGPRRADHSADRPARHRTRLRPRVYRWVAAGAIALLRWFRRLRIRWEIRDDIHQAFVTLGWAISAGDACAHPLARRRHEHFVPFGLTFSGCSADVHPATRRRGDSRGSRQVVRWPESSRATATAAPGVSVWAAASRHLPSRMT